MIADKTGQFILVDGRKFVVGGKVRTTHHSEYPDLEGEILEVRSGDDRETDNDSVDVYCVLYKPETEEKLLAIERVLAGLWGEPKSFDDVGFDNIIMAPEELITVADESKVFEWSKDIVRRIEKTGEFSWKEVQNIEIALRLLDAHDHLLDECLGIEDEDLFHLTHKAE